MESGYEVLKNRGFIEQVTDDAVSYTHLTLPTSYSV